MDTILHSFLSDHEVVERFIRLYREGKTIKQISIIFKIPERRAHWFKQRLNLATIPRWKQRGASEHISKRAEMILRGTLLGDASMHRKPRCSIHEFSITHSPKQIEYLKWKHQQLQEFKPQKICSSSDKWGSQRFHISHHPFTEKLYYEYYNKTKQVTIELLEQLDDLALTVWFMDDGNSFSHGYSLATCSFTLEENYLIKGYFKNIHGIEVKITNYDYPRIVFQKKASTQFRTKIEKYIIPSMQHKLHRHGLD